MFSIEENVKVIINLVMISWALFDVMVIKFST